eukprot:gene11570-18279_t
MMRREFPRVARWCVRVHDEQARAERGEEEWLAGDEVPAGAMELLQVFFAEFWPVLESTCRVLTAYAGGVCEQEEGGRP